MPKAKKNTSTATKSKLYAAPTASKKKDFGVPKFAKRQVMPVGNSRPTTTAALSALAAQTIDSGPSTVQTFDPIDAALTTRDSSTKAFLRELRKVIDKSDVVIQVLDARDPEGTRSRWVEDEVRKREADGKKLLAVVNKIDLVPRQVLEAWLKHLRHSFPCMPFKSSTQSQRNNLSQNAVPLNQKGELSDLPVTSSSLGAPALLNLLKQYALSTPHSSLTVGVVGYPNVGKSSLINSLKRSRACAVAAMPGKTRVVQEVILDKGVKIIDCPGVVLADMAGADKQKQAEIMLRNCIKAELVEDPIAPVEAILAKTDHALLQKLYNVPPFADVREFLVRIALVRGRLGRGGIPDLEGSAVSVLRDWNSGKIPYHTLPPVKPAKSADYDMSGAAGGGGDQVLNQLSSAFTLDGLLDFGAGGEGTFDGEYMDDAETVDEPPPSVQPVAFAQPSAPVFSMPADSDDDLSDADASDFDDYADMPLAPSHSLANATQRNIDPARLFTPEELATLPASVLEQRQRAAAKKAKKRRAEAERTGGSLAFGMLGMDVDEGKAKPEAFVQEEWDGQRLSKKERKAKAKVRAREREMRERKREMERAGGGGGMDMDMDMDGGQDGGMGGAGEMDDERREKDFAAFLANVAGDSDEEL